MIVDLASSGFQHMSLHIDFEAGCENIRTLWESHGLASGHRAGDEFHYRELAGFRKDGQHYRVQIRLLANEDGSSGMGIAYQLGRVPRPSARRANLSKVGSILDALRVPCSVSSMAHGDFPADRFKPIISLPLIRFNMPHVYFDEIRGVRLAKIRDGVESDSVDMAISDEDELHVFAETSYNTISGSDLPVDSLARLTALRYQAVVEVRPDTQEQG